MISRKPPKDIHPREEGVDEFVHGGVGRDFDTALDLDLFAGGGIFHGSAFFQ
jgi:hypothetical protein